MTNWVSCGLLVLAVSLSSNLANAAYANFAGLETENLRFVPTGSCKSDFARVSLDTSRLRANGMLPPKEESSGLTGMFKWTPDGKMENGAYEGCSPAVLESILQKNAGSAAKQAQALRSFFGQCDQHLSRNAPGQVFQLLWLTGMKYELCDNPNIRRVVAKLDDGKILRGLLALKPGTTKRPLVIVRCGLFCNTGDITQRIMMMHLFDESPFHVLAVNSMTGSEFVRDNGHLGIGGLDEGAQALNLARIVNGSKITDTVSSIHYVGVSLGGQSALYASYMAPHNKVQEGDAPAIASSMAICPVVDLEPSHKGLFSRPTVGSHLLAMLGEQVATVISVIPAIGARLFPEVAQGGAKASPEMMTRAFVSHYRSRGSGWSAKPFDDLSINSEADLWRANKFTALAGKPLEVPTLVIAANDDMLVPTDLNAKALQAKIQGNAGVVRTAGGNHCGFSLAYGWPTMSTIYRNFILSHAPEFAAAKKTKSARIPGVALNTWDGDRVHTIEYDFAAGVANLAVKVRVIAGSSTAPGGEYCSGINASVAPASCYTDHKFLLPLSSIAGRPSWARVPRTEAEAQALTRWANVNLAMLGIDGKSVTGRAVKSLQSFRWTAWD